MSIAATYVDSDTFTVDTYLISEFHAGRRIKASCGEDGYKYGTITSSSYSDSTAVGTTTVNLDAASDDLTSNLTEVWYGIVGIGIGQSLPTHDHSDSDNGGGSVDHADLTNLNSTTYSHLTSAQKTDLTDGLNSTAHKHYHDTGLNNMNSTTYYHITQSERGDLITPGYTTIHSHDYLSGVQGKYVLGQTEGTYTQDPDDAATSAFTLTKHANCPGGDVDYWWIRTTFWNGLGSTNHRGQIAIKYKNAPMTEGFIRAYITSWTPWTRIDQAEAGVKGWINFNGSGTIASRDSFNVSSITDNGTGQYTIAWDTNFSDYIQVNAGCAGRSGDGNLVVGMQNIGTRAPAAGTSSIEVRSTRGSRVDATYVLLMACGVQ